ncbi:SusC/RagA family TonB-linked outer membrane protein [Pedobacter frigoris]|uniref:SusC/RagA family TonB-linked outer membrane protein n=1 Tax=Pedobacter frigoris TaxID=2571272 RepID=UPI002930335F|nr:SusC/RagA family TonB-linked outer membrane protein [Pedobacter frigoris]
MKGILQMHLRVLGIVFMLLQSHYVFAQVRISGTVVESDGKVPLAGATIATTGTPKSTATTDGSGKFTITVANGAMLRITTIGYKPVTIAAKEGMTVEMVSTSIDLDETVVVGYTTQKKELLSGSVATVKFTETETEIPTTSVGNLLAGRMPGLYVSTPSGIPGAQPGIRIRTANPVNGAATLYVIDGKVTSDAGEFNNLSPNEIDEITILKDAATTAAYGARAAGGVMLVTTKRGKAGKASVNYSVNTGKDVRGRNMELTNIMEWGDIYHRITGAADNLWTEGAKAYFKDTDFGGGKGYGFNALKDVYVDPSITTHNVSASGGTDRLQYFVGGSFVNQETFIKNTNEKKYNVRTNVTAKLTEDVEVFAGFSLNNNKFSEPQGDWSGDMFPKLLVWQPYMPSFNNAGLPAYYFWITNKPAEANGMAGYSNRESIRSVINLNATYKAPFLQGLSAKVGYIKSYTNTNQKIYSHPFTYYELKQIEPAIWDLDGPTVSKTLSQHSNYIEKLSAWNQEDQLNFQVNFDRTFAKHHVNAALIYERQERSGDGIDAAINGFPIYTTDQWWASTGGAGVINGTATKSVSNTYGFEVTTGRKSFIGQLAYDYDGKYIATFTSRYDGSVIFAPDKRWGFFPAASAAWIVSKENFFRNVKGIESLKLRASFGVIGNDNVARWQYEDSYRAGSSAFFGESPSLNPGIQYGTFPNPNITWEKYSNRNIGIDISFLKHFSATAEYWNNLTSDVLGQRIGTTPPTFSRSLPAVNYGKMEANGIDLALNYNNSVGAFNYNVGATFTYGDSRYKVWDQNITYDYQDRLKSGRSANYITGYTVDKLLRSQADVDALLADHPGYNFNGIAPKPGQFAYKDFNGDNKIDNNDIQVLNNSNNAKSIGLNLSAEWKGISINANFNGSFGYKKSFNDLSGGVEWNRMWRPWYDQSWTPENPTGSWLPYRYSANDAVRSVNTSGSDFWLADASFVRLKFLNVAYNVPQKFYKKYVNNIRFYLSGSNLFVISKFDKKFYDPEMGGGTSFPIVKSYNAGLSVTF